MQIELLKEIVIAVVGKNAESIVDLLYNKKNVNEFLIAKKLNLTINQTRTILYKLADEGLVSFIRKKDTKKGGWYTYFWTLNSGKSLIRFRDKLLNEIERIKEKIEERKGKQFFYCKNCLIEYDEEKALLQDYTCPECGNVLSIKNNLEEITKLEKDINRISSILSSLNAEINIISLKENKARNRKMQAEKKKKEKERLEKRKERERIAKKEAKKLKKNKKNKSRKR